jgi:hypothetical protein
MEDGSGNLVCWMKDWLETMLKHANSYSKTIREEGSGLDFFKSAIKIIYHVPCRSKGSKPLRNHTHMHIIRITNLLQKLEK